ncbi:properdin-like, partial [Saccoglossus kowalevskii]|uniref:Hemicentin-1-like n=1 Tax=Saccoglossus kowalevskii TaxID=10224 RepID=A0ABM0MNM8_SACKO
ISVWTPWSPWSPCSVTCDIGSRTKSRLCTHPESGMICEGEALEQEICTPVPCPIDGGWSNWSPWTPCSKTCGGTREQVRVCDNPAPLHSGSYCIGDMYRIDNCGDNTTCPVNGNWGHWSTWAPCSVTCGQGLSRRYRVCNNPEPMNEGEKCPGKTREHKSCGKNNDPCYDLCEKANSWPLLTAPPHDGSPSLRVDFHQVFTEKVTVSGLMVFNPEPLLARQGSGVWSTWSHWGTCTNTCGVGQQFRQRLCKDNICSGPNQQQKPCLIKKCPTIYTR